MSTGMSMEQKIYQQLHEEYYSSKNKYIPPKVPTCILKKREFPIIDYAGRIVFVRGDKHYKLCPKCKLIQIHDSPKIYRVIQSCTDEFCQFGHFDLEDKSRRDYLTENMYKQLKIPVKIQKIFYFSNGLLYYDPSDLKDNFLHNVFLIE